MNDERRGLADEWPLLVTCAGIIAMGAFVITATDEMFGWVFVVFGVVAIVWTAATSAIAAVRGRRD